MVRFEFTETFGWKGAFRGMRNAKNSWEKSDSWFWPEVRGSGCNFMTNVNNTKKLFTGEMSEGYQYGFMYGVPCFLGKNDISLAHLLIRGGTDEAKFLRDIHVQVDITAPLCWWKEFDTYKVGTVRNSCSTMHKIASRHLTMEDFDLDELTEIKAKEETIGYIIQCCNELIDQYNETKDMRYFRLLVKILPDGYMQRATVDLNYAVIRAMYWARKGHKQLGWRNDFVYWCENLPYFEELIRWDPRKE